MAEFNIDSVKNRVMKSVTLSVIGSICNLLCLPVRSNTCPSTCSVQTWICSALVLSSTWTVQHSLTLALSDTCTVWHLLCPALFSVQHVICSCQHLLCATIALSSICSVQNLLCPALSVQHLFSSFKNLLCPALALSSIWSVQHLLCPAFALSDTCSV